MMERPVFDTSTKRIIAMQAAEHVTGFHPLSVRHVEHQWVFWPDEYRKFFLAKYIALLLEQS